MFTGYLIVDYEMFLVTVEIAGVARNKAEFIPPEKRIPAFYG